MIGKTINKSFIINDNFNRVFKKHQIPNGVDSLLFNDNYNKKLEFIPTNIKYIEFGHNFNLPIEKELVFKMVPELFVHEINKLGAKERQRFKAKRISYARADGEKLEVDDLASADANRLVGTE